ncbi:MAG: 16S rRNA (adenine(1518)-N(6)/adenine(1519)-N(6))-dimethyltransferase RsmA [Acidimicrobiales bacterium]
MSLSRSAVLGLLAEHGFRPSKRLGQNFVADPNTVERVVRLAELPPSGTVVEIGAGLGSLTHALVSPGRPVVAVEVDERLVAILRAGPLDPSVEVVHGDALRLDWTELLADRPGPVVLIGNLPYSVATSVVVRVLEEAQAVERLVVMVQREVGERWVAGPGDPAYGAVSVKVAYWTEAALLGRVPPTVFVPQPKVESVLVRLVRRVRPAVDPSVVAYARLEAVVRAGFGQRRKMLRRSLAGTVEPEAFEAAGVAPSARAEELGVEAWGELARVR